MNEIIKQYGIDNSDWIHKGFHGVSHTFFPVEEEAIISKKTLGYSVNTALFFSEGHYIHHFWNKNDLTRIRNIFFQRLDSDPKYLEKLKNDWNKDLAIFDAIILKTDRTNLAKLTDKQLVFLYDEFYRAYVKEYSYFMALGDAISMQVEDYLIPEFKKVLQGDFNNLFSLLVSTHHVSFIEKEQRARDAIIEIYRRTGTIPHDMLEKHAKEFFYIKNNYAKAIYFSASDFKKEIIAESRMEVDQYINVNRSNDTINREKTFEEYNFTDHHKILLYVMDEFFGIQDTRKKYVLISNYYQFNFLAELSRRTNIDYELLRFSVQPEFKDILEKGIDIRVLSDRKDFGLCLCNEEGYKIVVGNNARQVYRFIIQSTQANMNNHEVKGIVASKGKATGRVKIVLKIHDMINFEKGDVLVSSMTRPEMIPAMKQAVAIVTDEGGMTSHAAIVARELKVPCIIGTKYATTIFKNGDMVDVDAEDGKIRKI
ncbi:MAG: PEP-utilizing enzyme [bacterium]